MAKKKRISPWGGGDISTSPWEPSEEPSAVGDVSSAIPSPTQDTRSTLQKAKEYLSKAKNTLASVFTKQYWQPAPQVRARDVIREIYTGPLSTYAVAKKAAEEGTYAVQHPVQAAKNVAKGLGPLTEHYLLSPFARRKEVHEAYRTGGAKGAAKEAAKQFAGQQAAMVETGLLFFGGAEARGAKLLPTLGKEAATGLGFGATEYAGRLLQGEKPSLKGAAREIVPPTVAFPVLSQAGRMVFGARKIKVTPEEEKSALDYVMSRGTKLRETLTIHPEDKRIMANYIDASRIGGGPSRQLATDAQRIAEHYNIRPKGNQGLADAFDESLQRTAGIGREYLRTDLELNKGKVIKPLPTGEGIAQAKASGQSFDEWVKGQKIIENKNNGGIIKYKDGELKYSVEDGVMIIDDIDVKTQKQGTGTVLMQEAEDVAETLGVERIELGAFPKNKTITSEQLRDFYENLGYNVNADMPFEKQTYYDMSKSVSGNNIEFKTRSQLKAEWDATKGIKEVQPPLFRLKDDFEKATGITISDQQEKQITDLNKKIFGDENIKITGQILTPKGQEALGSYRDGMIKILGGQADVTDTFYHEAVHKYLDVFTAAEEHASLLLQAQKQFGTTDFASTEERLAENFINYASGVEKTSPFKVAFDRIITRIKSYFRNEDTIKSFYDDILSGKAAKPTPEIPALPGVVSEDLSKLPTPAKALQTEPTPAELTAALEPSAKDFRSNLRSVLLEKAQGYEAQAQQRELYDNILGKETINEIKKVLRSKAAQEPDFDVTKIEGFDEIAQVLRDYTGRPDMSSSEALDLIDNLPTWAEINKQKPVSLKPLGDVQQVFKPAEGREVMVPSSQLPVGEGEVKPSRLADRLTRRIENLTEEQKQSIPNYQVMNKQDQIAKAAAFVEKYPDDTMAILQGKKQPPQGLLRNSLALAMEEKAVLDKDGDLAMKLGSLYSTRAGQEISILTERDPESPVRYISDIQTARIERKGGAEVVNKARQREVANLNNEIKKAAPTKNQWANFIDSIKCH